MKVCVLQHAPNEGPGSIKTWADKLGHEFTVYHPETFGILPSSDEVDFLVMLGSPMSPNDEESWISEERKLIQKMLDQHKPMLGICFGAQQIAKTLSAKVLDAPYKEVGWSAVHYHGDALPDGDTLLVPEQVEVLHWHQQMFEIPQGAKLLFSGDLNKNQGFIYGDNVIGLQFHLEPEKDNVREIAINDCQYPKEDNALHQTSAEIIAHTSSVDNAAVMDELLDYLTKKAN